MKRYVLSILTMAGLAAAIPISALGQAQPGNTQPNSVDRQFVQQAMLANAEELKTADIMRHSSNASVRLFARTMVRDHGVAVSQLAALANQENLPFPRAAVVNVTADEGAPPRGEPSSATHGNVAAKPASPRQYMQQQIADHKKAIALYENELKNGSDQYLKAYAAKVLPRIRNHLTMAQQYMTVGRITPEPAPTPCTTSYSC